jgi:type II secretion system protein D
VLPVRSMPAARLQGTIQSTFSVSASQRGEALVVQVDRDRNALVISSSQKMYDEIKDVVEELDRVTVDDGGSIGPVGVGQGVYIIDVQNHSPSEMRALLEQMGVTRPQPSDRPGVVSEPVTITTLTTRSALAVVAGARDGQTIKALVASLDSQPVTPEQHMAVVRLKLATASVLTAVVERMLNPADQDSRTSPAQALAEQVRRLNLHRTGVAEEDLGLDLSVPIRLIADDFTNSIIVASTKANVASIAQVIETLDTLPIGDAVVVRIFPLDNASATRVRGVVEQLFAQGEALRRLPGTRRLGLPPTATGQALAGEITVAVDERTNALIVAGREEAVALVEVLIADLDGDDVAQWIEPVLIPLEHADAVTLAKKLNTVLVRGLRTMPDAIGLQRQIARLQMVRAGGDPTNPDDAIQSDLFSSLTGLVIEPEETLNALIIVGSRDNIAVIRELTEMLDVEAAAASNTVRVYPLEYAAADRVASMVSDIFKQREQAGQITRPEDRVIVIADTRTNALTISTSPRSFEVVESLLETFDQAEARQTVSLHVIPVAHGDVADLAPVIERLMNQRIASTRRAGGVDSPMDVFSVSALPAIDSLIVQCSDENLAIVQDLLADLEEGSAVVTGADQSEIVQLSSNTPAADAASHLRDLYVDKENARRGDGSVGVVANERLNALILSGAGDDIAAMKQLIEDLEQTRPSITQQIRRIELTTANALEMVSLIQNVLAGPTLGPRRAGSPQATIVQFYREQVAAKLSEQGLASSEAEVDGAIRDHVTLTPDLRTNSVIIKAPPEIGALIADMINDLDTTDAGERQYELFQLVNADARQMATILVDLFNLRQQGASYVLMPAGQTDEEQDTEGEGTAFGGITVTPVPDERQQLSVTVDARTNSLLVGGTEEYLELVRNVVKELDEIEANEREQRVIELRYAKADDVQRVLQSYFRAEAERVMGVLGGERAGSIQRQLEREVTVIGDQKSNKIMFAASPRYIETVAQMIEELDAAPPQVMIQVLIAEVTVNEGDTWGIDMEFSGIGGDNFTLGSLAAGAGVATALGVPHLTVASSDIQLLIRSLREQGKLNVLSEPRLTVKNNETANMQVGEDIALINGVERFSDGSSVANVERRDVGIIMEVTPTISPDGFVHMVISPEISTVSAETDQLSPEVSAARISTRKLTTVVTVRDGQTIVIGGLFQTTQQDRKTHVPILSKIPVAGELFKSHDISEVKTELLVILTPRIIPGGLGGDDTSLEDFTERNIDHLPTTLDLRGAIHNFNPNSTIRPPVLIEPDGDKPPSDVEQIPEDETGSAGFPEEW